MKTLAFCILISTLVLANDLIPGKKQTKPIVIKGAKIFTVSGEVIDNGSILFDKGVITAIGESSLPAPESAEVIDVAGKHVYPGLIAAYSQLGLVEVGAVRATRDFAEVGSINPNARADIAYNPDSEVPPTVRSNGITTALIAPSSGLLSGTSSVLHLDGWNREDMTVLKDAGVHLNWPRMTVVNAWWVKESAEKQQEKISKNLKEIEEFFAEAKVYTKARQSNPNTKMDIRFEAMVPVIERKVPLIIRASEYKQIESAIDFCRRNDLKMILLDGADAWKLADLLKENDVPVIYQRTHSLPAREDEDFDMAFKTPLLLREAGVKFCISKTSGDVFDIRNLPFYAGTAAAHGLSKTDALKTITLWPAEILGIADKLGSLEVGKSATLIVCDGDIMDFQSSKVQMMFIDGRKVDLDDKHKRLYRKYKARYLE